MVHFRGGEDLGDPIDPFWWEAAISKDLANEPTLLFIKGFLEISLRQSSINMILPAMVEVMFACFRVLDA